MLELTLGSRLAITLTFFLVGGVGFGFYLRQNRTELMGGGISKPKAVWLTYAVYVWFFMTPILALDTNIASPHRIILGAFACSMWVRGIAELLMLYVWKNWKPPYGITHNLFSLALLLGGGAYFAPSIVEQSGDLNRWVLSFIAFLILAMLCETYYALNFHDTVQGQTTGDDGVWFASADDEKFKRINRITALCNAPIVGFTLAFIAAWIP